VSPSGSRRRGSKRAAPGSPAAVSVDVGGPAPAGALVAVVERHGRFLTAEPLFPPRERDRERETSRRGASSRLTLGAARGGRAGAIEVSDGQLVLVHSAARGGGSGVRVLRLLGRPDVARDVIEALMLDRGLARGFDPALEREARGAGEAASRAPGERRDLRQLPTLTIDPISARDFDDAISAEPLEGADAGTRVWVHIADVAAHVPAGSPLDREARRRSTSVYVPGAVEPMLPEALSSDACSLVAGADRPAVTVELELREGVVTRAAFYRSLINSDARLDYEQVDRIFAGAESADDPWGAPLRAARDAAAGLQRRRERSGALVVDSEEPEFEFDGLGNVVAIRGRLQTESHRLIEHLMIAANEAVAGLLSKRRVPCLYRVHETPAPERVERLADQLATLEVPTPTLPEHMSSTQAAELLGDMSRRVEQHVRRVGHGRQALGSLVLRSLKQAYYSPKNLGHAGLRSPSYCHFTSPIRRYPDLVCHRAMLSAVGAGESAPRAGELVELGAWTSERERDAMIIERDADDIARCFALEQLIHERGLEQPFAGEITGLISAGAFIAFDQRAGDVRRFEGMLPVRLLRAPPASGGHARQADGRGRGGARRPAARERPGEVEREWWELNEQGTILHGERTGATLRLGEEIDVRVVRVDSVRGRVDLEPPPSRSQRTPPRSPSGRSRSNPKR
jgi:ribonuclease R